MRIVVDNQASTTSWANDMRARPDLAAAAAHEAGVETAQEIETQGRADIAGAGRFGPSWIQSLNATVEDTPDGVKVTTTMRGGWRIFEDGGTVQGKPLLWIPFSDSDAVGVRSSKYPGDLKRVDSRRGVPLLISTSSHKPTYFGKESVFVPKKFHLTEIAEEVGGQIGDKYQTAFEGLGGNG